MSRKTSVKKNTGLGARKKRRRGIYLHDPCHTSFPRELDSGEEGAAVA